MMNTIKSLVAVSATPVLLMVIFHTNVIKASELSRSPAVEKSESLRSKLKGYSLPVR